MNLDGGFLLDRIQKALYNATAHLVLKEVGF